jgi:hypothetical protein
MTGMSDMSPEALCRPPNHPFGRFPKLNYGVQSWGRFSVSSDSMRQLRLHANHIVIGPFVTLLVPANHATILVT